MAQKPVDNSKFILPLALGAGLIAVLAQYVRLPTFVIVLGCVAFAAAVPGVIAYLFVRQSGWRDLWHKYPAAPAMTGAWQTCRTAIMATVGLDDPDYQRSKVRLNFIVRVRCDDQALYVSAIRFFALLLPPLRIPWSAIARVRYFDPSGWYTYAHKAGFVFQLNYDPGYAEQFVEIQIAEPATFIQLPTALLRDAIPQFPV